MRNLNIIELHCQFLEDFGFEFDSSRMYFFKDFPQGQQVVFIHFAEFPEGNILEYKLGVRIHQVEELIHKFLPTLSGYADSSITLLQAPDKIGKQIPNQFILDNDGQLADAIMAAEKFFVLEGIKWLDHMIDPVNLEKAFAVRKERSFRSHNFVYNSFRGATLAKLYNPVDYPILRSVYLGQIKEREMTPFTIASFLQLLDYLDKYPIVASSSLPGQPQH